MERIYDFNDRYFFDSRGNFWEIDLTKKIIKPEEGRGADLYLQDNPQTNETIIFKKYNELANDCMNYYSFETFKQIENPHFVKLKERYYSIFSNPKYKYIVENPSASKIVVENPSAPKIDGYTKEFIQEQKINILKKKKDYLIQNIFELQKLFNIFSQNGIHVLFRYPGDIKINSNGIVINNPDNFSLVNEKPNYSLEQLSQHNQYELIELLRMAFSDGYSQLSSKLDFTVYRNTVEYLFSYDLANSQDIASEVNKKLKLSKRPLDYMKKKINK